MSENKKWIIAVVVSIAIGFGLLFGSRSEVAPGELINSMAPFSPTVAVSTEFEITTPSPTAKVSTPAPTAAASQGGSQETPKATASTGSPEASAKPPVASQKPTVSQTPTPPASTPATASEPPVASQKPNGDDSGKGNEPEVTPTPSQGPQNGPPSRDGRYDGERTSDGKWEWWGLGINEWVAVGGSDGGISGQFGTEGEVLSGHKVGNM